MKSNSKTITHLILKNTTLFNIQEKKKLTIQHNH